MDIFIVVVIIILIIAIAMAISYKKTRISYVKEDLVEHYKKPESYDRRESEDVIRNLKKNLSKIDPGYGQVSIIEGFKGASTKNKKIVSICLRNPDTGKFYSENTLMYVLLHELAHVISPTYGHDDNFKERMNDLLFKAKELGIYDPDIPIPKMYCGVKSTHT